MRIKSMIIVLVTVLLTVLMVENNSVVSLWFFGIQDIRTHTLTMMLTVGIIAFVLGILVGRPTRVKKLGVDYAGDDTENTKPNTLSDEDRDYIH